MLRVGVGHSDASEPGLAAREAVGRAIGEGPAPQLALVFCAATDDLEALLVALAEALPGVAVVGCTSAAQLSSDLGVRQQSVCVTTFASDTLRFSAGLGTGQEAGAVAVAQAMGSLTGEPTVCLALPGGAAATEAMLGELAHALPSSCRVFGGAASRHGAVEAAPRAFVGTQAPRDALALVLISGPVRAVASISSGWEPVGVCSVVGDVDGRTVGQIGAVPALDFYRRYLGPHTTPAFEFPLAVHRRGGLVLRVPVSYDEAARSVTFGAPIPDGAEVQITRVDAEHLLSASHDAVAEVASQEGTPSAHVALVFTCNARRSILGTRVTEELAAVQRALPGVKVAGFYGFAELGPAQRGAKGSEAGSVGRLHHCTLVTLLLGDGSEPLVTEVLPRDSKGDVSSRALLRRLEQVEYDRQDHEKISRNNARLLEVLATEGVARSQGGAGGLMLPGYELLEELGRGGAGAVYRARDLSLGREVALKVLLTGHSASVTEVERFKREAYATARLRHPHIVGIYGQGQDVHGHWFLSMELVAGESLADRLASGPLPTRQAVEVVRKVAEAVAYAHERSVLHRDLKPHNVMIRADGEPVLLDFGLAKLLEGSHARLTRTGAGPMGSPAYMAPEQAHGDHAAVDARTDVYGLGALLYESVSGLLPLDAGSFMALLLKVVSERPRPLRSVAPQADASLEAICARCLEKDPADRYPSAAALVDDLEQWLVQDARADGAGRGWSWLRGR